MKVNNPVIDWIFVWDYVGKHIMEWEIGLYIKALETVGYIPFRNDHNSVGEFIRDLNISQLCKLYGELRKIPIN